MRKKVYIGILTSLLYFSCSNEKEPINYHSKDEPDTVSSENYSEKDSFDYSLERYTCVDDTNSNVDATENSYDPSYKGGEKAIQEFIKTNIIKPKWVSENKISGSITVEVLISKKGELLAEKVLRKMNNCSDCSEIALNVVKKMKNWNPGYSLDKKGNKIFEDKTTAIEVFFD